MPHFEFGGVCIKNNHATGHTLAHSLSGIDFRTF